MPAMNRRPERETIRSDSRFQRPEHSTPGVNAPATLTAARRSPHESCDSTVSASAALVDEASHDVVKRAAPRKHTARRGASRAQGRKAEGGVTFKQLAHRFKRDCRYRWKPSTFASHCRQIDRQLTPVFGTRQVSMLSRNDVEQWYENPATACPRALSVLSSTMRHAEELGLRAHNTNPCAGLRKKQTGFKANCPDADGYGRIGHGIRNATGNDCLPAAIVEFLAMTGARRSEALSAEWNHLHGNRLVLPDSKSGPRTIWLAKPVLDVLARLQRSENQQYIFGSEARSVVSSRLTSFWLKLRREHKLPRMRVHDLRHGFASEVIKLGHGLRTAGRLLGHVDFKTTLGYVHLDEAPLRRASERVANKFRNRVASPKSDRRGLPRSTKKAGDEEKEDGDV